MPEHHGIGVRLLSLTEDHVRPFGRSEIRLYTNEAMTENLAYYVGMGTQRPTGPSRTDSAGCSSVNPSTGYSIRGRSGRSPGLRWCMVVHHRRGRADVGRLTGGCVMTDS